MKKQSYLTKLLYGIRHEFDLENPINDEIKITQEYKLSGHKNEYIMKVTGFKCKNCDKIYWLDRETMKNLSIPMKYGCSKK